MKKILILVSIVALMFVGCGSSNELEGFVEGFNKYASDKSVAELNEVDFEEIEVVDGRGWKNLYGSDKYYIDAKYEDGESLSGYYLVVEDSEPLEEFEGEGYEAGIGITRALNLSSGKFVRELATAFKEGSHSYTEGDYRISFSYPRADGLTSVGLIVNFDKK